MQSRILFLALSATLASTHSGHAQDSSDDKFYADVGYSRIGTDLVDLSESIDPAVEYGGLSGRVGYQFSKHWSLEGEAIVGVENDKDFGRRVVSTVDGRTLSLNRSQKSDLSHLVGISVKGTLPITQKLDAFARIGIANAEFDVSRQTVSTDLETEEATTSLFDTSYSETGVSLGVGLSYYVTDKIYLRSDYTRYDLIELELESVNVGVGIRF